MSTPNEAGPSKRWGILFCGVLLLLTQLGCAASQPRDVALALSKAGDNRGELEKVLAHYRDVGDYQKLAAAEFLIANMPGHGYSIAEFCDSAGEWGKFDALDYASFKEALAALDALEAEHGELTYRSRGFVPDIETITADYLIDNIDLAFAAWREKPWARRLTFAAFCEHVLPYRGSNEPINSWRAACMERYVDLPSKLDDPNDAQAAARLVQQDVGQWVRFDEIFYLHPTDQGF
ncbi:MAG: hypothetical protein JXO22_15730, partial [Phycisphaerae bacterium]|nr:hypothetical protein [Phycisphaerae bacterium]